MNEMLPKSPNVRWYPNTEELNAALNSCRLHHEPHLKANPSDDHYHHCSLQVQPLGWSESFKWSEYQHLTQKDTNALLLQLQVHAHVITG